MSATPLPYRELDPCSAPPQFLGPTDVHGVWARASDHIFAEVTPVGSGVHVSRDQTRPILGRGPASPKYLVPDWRLTYSDLIRYGNRRVFLGFSHAPILRGQCTSVPKYLGTLYMRANGMRNSNQVLRDQTRFLHDRPRHLSKISVTGMLTRDLFAV